MDSIQRFEGYHTIHYNLDILLIWIKDKLMQESYFRNSANKNQHDKERLNQEPFYSITFFQQESTGIKTKDNKMNPHHQSQRVHSANPRQVSRPVSSQSMSRNNSAVHQYDVDHAKPHHQKQDNTIKNFIDTHEQELMSTGYNMNGSRVYLASSYNQKFDSPDKKRNSSIKQYGSRKNSQSNNKRCNTVGVEEQEANKGFNCVNYRSRERYTNIGGARRRALSSVGIAQGNANQNTSQDRMNQTQNSFSPVKHSMYQSIVSHEQRSQPQDDRLLIELRMSGSRIFKSQVTQFRRRPIQEGQQEPMWDLHDEDMAQRLKELSAPKKYQLRQIQQCTIGGNKTMDLQNPQSQEFISRLSAPRKYVPWPSGPQGAKTFNCGNSDQIEYLNKISLPRRMAHHGHQMNFRYNFCNCNNGDDYADEGRNYQGSQSSSANFKLQSFFYQNSKAQDDGLFYPKQYNY